MEKKIMNYLRCSTEFQEQKKLFQWIYLNKELKDCVFSIPNGGSRNLIEAKNLKISGVRPGIPDIFVPIARNGYNGLFIELKRKFKSKISAPQQNMISILSGNGYKCEVCYGADQAILEIEKYLKED